MNENSEIILNEIKNKIYTIRGFQVMLDSDLAIIYEIKAIRLREQLKRNLSRFPSDFCFQLTENEIEFMVSQFAIPSKKHLGGSKPYVFTEQGIAMLSSILNSEKAISINIQIMRAFISMRKIISQNKEVFIKLDILERKSLDTESKFEKIFNLLENPETKRKQGIFFEGQIFDSHIFISDLIKSATKEIILIDKYIDENTLILFSKRQKGVKVIIHTKIDKTLKLDLDKYNSQYEKIEIKEFNLSHDRFLIIDKKEMYHIGASLKDIGKKWFAFSKLEKENLNILERI